MIAVNRLGVGIVIAGVSLASIAGCRRDPSTASRSAAAYDEAQRQGVPLAGGGGGGHDDHAAPPPAARGSEGVTGESTHAGHDEAMPSHARHAGGESPGGERPESGMDHAAMGHASTPAPAPSPEPASSTALPGQPERTLHVDALDAPAATSVREAARSREMAGAGQAMAHGAYRQVDAGREDVPVTSPNADPHAGHVMPVPRPTPSPAPKENR